MKYGITLLFLICACGYHLVGTQRSLPSSIHNLYIPVFKNKTNQPEIEQRLTQWVAEEFVNRGKMAVVSHEKEADAILYGEITNFSLTPLALDAEGRASDYLVNLTLSVRLVQNDQDKTLLWQNPSFIYRERYDVGVTAEDYFERLYLTIDTLGQQMAQSLVVQVMEGF